MNKILDERQLMIRGNIFKHGLFLLTALLLSNSLLYNLGFEWVAGKWAELTLILLTVVFCSIEFIYFDIYPLTRNIQKIGIFLLGLFGSLSVVSCLYEITTQKTGFVMDGKITNNALGIVYGFMFISLTIAYIIKAYYNKRNNVID